MGALGAGASARAEGADLISADTLSVNGDFRLVAVNGEPSWTVDGSASCAVDRMAIGV
jgi:hypothetical protein